MKAIIPVAGVGSRLRPHTYTLPKVPMNVAGNSIFSEDAQVQGALLENSIVGNNAMVRGVWKRINIGDSSEIDFF